MGSQIVDPDVSRTKYEREINNFKSLEDYYRGQGVFLRRDSFPDVVLVFTAIRVRPLFVVYTIKINFTNYDLEPPSVQFLDPITEEPITSQHIWSVGFRKGTETKKGANIEIQLQPQLIQAHAPNHIPFICLPGIREYHNHPSHSNDPWLTHRSRGEGELGFIINKLFLYGTNPITGITFQLSGKQTGNEEVQFFQTVALTIDQNLLAT